jgi:hypothetical protein
MAKLTSVVIFDDVLYQPGHMVWRYIGNLTRHFSANAKGFAPVRSGELKRRIRAGTPRKGGKRKVHGSIASNAPHTTYVLHGTIGPIFSDTPGHKLAVGRNLWGPLTPMREVDGQRSNNFFYWAWVATARQHPSIRGVPFPRVLH